MKTAFASLAIFLYVSFAQAGVYDLGGHGKLSLDVPTSWSVKGRDMMGKGYNLEIVPTNAANAACKITVIYGSADKPIDDADFESKFRAALEKLAAGSAEKKVESKKFNLKQGHGIYASFTDEGLVGKPPVKGNYKIMTTGAIKLDDTTAVAVSIFVDDISSDEFKQALKIVESMDLERVRPGS